MAERNTSRVIELGESDITGLQKTWRIARLVAELNEHGAANRELGCDNLERLVHRWPEGESLASHGVLDLAVFEASTAADISAEQFETMWQEAKDEEAFFAEHDPYGDRFGTSVPWWGCFGVLAILAAGVYVIVL